MGLDMYLLSYSRYHEEYVEPKIIMMWHRYINDIIRQYKMIPSYDDWESPTPPFSRSCYNFYIQKYIPDGERPDEWEFTYNDGIVKEEQYFSKAYTLATFLNRYYDNINEDDCSRELKKEDIIELQRFVNDEIAEYANLQGGYIIGYVDSRNHKHIFKNIKSILIEDIYTQESIEIPIEKNFYTEIPIEYLARDDWNLEQLLEAKKMCKRLLDNFDFENNVLVYYASY